MVPAKPSAHGLMVSFWLLRIFYWIGTNLHIETEAKIGAQWILMLRLHILTKSLYLTTQEIELRDQKSSILDAVKAKITHYKFTIVPL